MVDVEDYRPELQAQVRSPVSCLKTETCWVTKTRTNGPNPVGVTHFEKKPEAEAKDYRLTTGYICLLVFQPWGKEPINGSQRAKCGITGYLRVEIPADTRKANIPKRSSSASASLGLPLLLERKSCQLEDPSYGGCDRPACATCSMCSLHTRLAGSVRKISCGMSLVELGCHGCVCNIVGVGHLGVCLLQASGT